MKNFVITSHTGEPFSQQKTRLLKNLIRSLRHYFPDCFILLASASDVDQETSELVNFVFIDKFTQNFPWRHGEGEIKLVQIASDILARFGKDDFFKICYDFIIDDSNYTVFDNWLAHGKDFVSCYWLRYGAEGVGGWTWYGKVDFIKQIYSMNVLDDIMEIKLMRNIREAGLFERCFIYPNNNNMFNNTWDEKGDIVYDGGMAIKDVVIK